MHGGAARCPIRLQEYVIKPIFKNDQGPASLMVANLNPMRPRGKELPPSRAHRAQVRDRRGSVARAIPAGTANKGSNQDRWLVCAQKTKETVAWASTNTSKTLKNDV